MEIEERLADLIDDADFQAIVSRRSSFNLFEAVGAIRGELRHSNFLGFLLSPARNHGLGAQPLIRMLRAILAKMPRDERPLSALELIVGDLDGAIVDRELHNIDLLIEIRPLNLVVLIENKIDAKAGEGQLARYKSIVATRYPGHRRLLVFLTPQGTPPNEPGYVPFSYVEAAKVLESVAEAGPPEATLAVRHYVEMLRRHIVPDDHLRALARQLYDRHKEAFDFVNECKPQAQSMMAIARDVYEAQSPGLLKESETGAILRFVPDEWTSVPALNSCPPHEWTKTGRNLVFEIKTYSGEAYASRVNVALIVGPAEQQIRVRLYEGARERPDVFMGLVKPMGSKWATIFSRDLLGASAGKELAMDERAVVVNAAWADFISSNLPMLKAAIADIVL